MTGDSAESAVAPVPEDPDPADPRTALMGRVREALTALPGYFTSQTSIEGIAATDLFSLNTVLGATIEVQVVQTLNRMREVWDPDEEWPMHHFVRQPVTFPDVLLRRRRIDGTPDVALGIELKGWYILSKEAEPSFRYGVTPAACTPWDTLVVVPWHLSNVLSGDPVVLAPGLWPALHAAEYRNYWWRHIRRAKSDTTIKSPDVGAPYTSRDHTSDKPVSDSGGNFGRIARIGLMDEWVEETTRTSLAGIPARDWIEFFRRYAQANDPDLIWQDLRKRIESELASGSTATAGRATELVAELVRLLG